MVIDVVDVDREPIRESEGYPPISGYRDGVVSLQFALQRMEPEPRQIHIVRTLASIKHRQNISELLEMLRRDPSCRSTIVEGLSPRCLNDKIIEGD